MVRWQWCTFSVLSTRELYEIMAARMRVFIVEQSCVYQDLDGLDEGAHHLVGWSDDSVAAYLRVLSPNTRFAERSIGRVITTQVFRGQGLGREVMQRAIDRFAADPIRISAQAHLAHFYASFDFAPASAPYDEDGIPHIQMLRTATT
jgi:ElaA protein